MTLKNLLNKKSEDDFIAECIHFGLLIENNAQIKINHYVDLEAFFLAATYHMNTSRITEGFLCWLVQFSHLLSPSKIRRLIKNNTFYDTALLGVFISYIQEYCINAHQYDLLKPFIKKKKIQTPLIPGPQARKLNKFFDKYNLIAPNYQLDKEKFLQNTTSIYKKCIELKNRALFGSTVNADIASFLKWNPNATPYQIAKTTNNHKASVFKVFQDIKLAI